MAGLFDIFGGGSSSEATDKAIGQLYQGNAAYNYAGNASMDLLKQYLGNATNYLQPYYKQGVNAENTYAGLLGLPGASTTYNPTNYLTQSPGYQFGLSQGNDAMNAQMSAQGMYGSGPQREASQKFGQNYGMNYYNQLMNQLSGLAQTGQNAGTQMGNWNMNTGQGLANLEMGMGQNAQNTMATTAGMGLQSSLQNQRNQSANTLGWLGTGLSALFGNGIGQALTGGGNSLMGQGVNYLSNMLGPLMSGAGGISGGGDALNWAP